MMARIGVTVTSSGCSIPSAKRPIGERGSSNGISNVIEQLLTPDQNHFQGLRVRSQSTSLGFSVMLSFT
jgi:hypothetical protein